MAGFYNFNIDQGSDYSLLITYKDSDDIPVNLTGMTITSKARSNKESKLPSFQFVCTARDQSTFTGQYFMTLSNQITSSLDVSINNKFYYDVEIEKQGVITRLFQGQITISREITR